MGGVDLVPAPGVFFIEDSEERAAVEFVLLRCRPGEAENRWRQVDPAHHGVGRTSAFLLRGRPDHQRQPHSRLIEIGLGAGKGDAVVAEVEDEGVVVELQLLQDLHQHTESLVESCHRLVVLGELAPALDGVGEVGRHDHVFGLEGLLLDAGEFASIAEEIRAGQGVARLAPAPMRVRGAEVEEEGLVGFLPEPGPAFLSHGDGVSRASLVALEVGVEMVDLLGLDMILADAGGSVAGGREEHRQAPDALSGMKVVVGVLVSVLAVGVVVQPRKDHRTAGRAACSGAIGMLEDRAIGCQAVEVRGLDRLVAVAAGIAALVVDHEHDNVATGGLCCMAGAENKGKQAGCERQPLDHR